MTAAEKIAWDYLRKKQTNFRFLRQYSVDRFIIDFYCPKLKLAIEVDGSIHELQKNIENDRTREKYLAGYGINFIRTKNEEWIGNPELVKKELKKQLS
jgi:very-short-patch-repair endonuclease